MPETYANIPLFMAYIKIILLLLILIIVAVIAIISIMQPHENTEMYKSNRNVYSDIPFCYCAIMNKNVDGYFYEYLTAYQHKEDGHIIFVPDSLYSEWYELTKDEDCWKRIDSCFIQNSFRTFGKTKL